MKRKNISNDLVRRWDVFVYLTEYYNHRTELQHDCLKQALSRVPSAEPEIIRCKDCRHNDGACCYYSTMYIRPNGYCYWGERREDA